MAAAAYPCVTGTDHRILGPAAGHLRNRPVSLEMLVRSGPRNCVQSDPCAAGSREATPAAPTPMIQPRRVSIQNFSSCVEKNNTFARSITDRKSTRLNSSHLGISYAVFCLKKKKNK